MIRRRVRLQRETLRALAAPALQAVAGGDAQPVVVGSHAATCWTCWPQWTCIGP